jgi:hypothetical protein
MLSAHNIIGASQCFEQWHYATCHNYSITDYRWTRQGPFWGHISARSFGALTVSQLASFTYEFRVEVIRGSAEIRVPKQTTGGADERRIRLQQV